MRMDEGGREQNETAPRMSAATAHATWLLLVGATLLGWLLARGASMPAALIAIADAKIYLVMAVYMGLWRTPAIWHVNAVLWIVATGIAVYLLSAGALA